MTRPRSDDGRLTDEEWLLRYNQRFKERADWPRDYSEDIDMPIAELREDFDDCPEDAADEEMSYWDDNGNE